MYRRKNRQNPTEAEWEYASWQDQTAFCYARPYASMANFNELFSIRALLSYVILIQAWRTSKEKG